MSGWKRFESSVCDLCEDRRIRWLVAYPKSGTTWVRMFLNAAVTGFPSDINSPFHWVSTDSLPYYYNHLCSAPIARLDKVWLSYYRPAALANIILTGRTQDVVLRTHWPKVRINGTAMCPPHLSRNALVVVRDPRDIVISFAHYMNKSIDDTIDLMENEGAAIAQDEDGLFHFLSSWSTHVNSWTKENKDIKTWFIRYEDLLESPEKWFRKVLEVLGKPSVTEERIKWAIEDTRFDKLKDQEEERGFRESGTCESFFRRGQAGGWRDDLTTEQVKRIEDRHGETMKLLGYKLSTEEGVSDGDGRCIEEAIAETGI